MNTPAQNNTIQNEAIDMSQDVQNLSIAATESALTESNRNKRPVACTHCGEIFASRGHRDRHVLMCHSDGISICYPESSVSVKVPLLNSKFTCRCGKQYSLNSQAELRKHAQKCYLSSITLNPETSVQQEVSNQGFYCGFIKSDLTLHRSNCRRRNQLISPPLRALKLLWITSALLPTISRISKQP